MNKKVTAKKSSPKKKPAPSKKPLTPKGKSPYEIAAAKAISLNPQSAAYSAAIAVIEVLLKEAKKAKKSPDLLAFLEAALKNAKDGTGQNGGDPVPDMPNPGPHAK